MKQRIQNLYLYLLKNKTGETMGLKINVTFEEGENPSETINHIRKLLELYDPRVKFVPLQKIAYTQQQKHSGRAVASETLDPSQPYAISNFSSLFIKQKGDNLVAFTDIGAWGGINQTPGIPIFI